MLDTDKHIRFRESGTYKDTLFYPRPPSPNGQRRQALDLQEQLSFFRDEILKKDRLISQLTSMETPRPTRMDSSHIDETSDRFAGNAIAKSEIASLQVKVDSLQTQLREAQVQLNFGEDKLKDMRRLLESSKENEAKQAAMLQTVRAKLLQYEAHQGSVEGAACRSEVTIQTLQRENKNYQERLLELESRLRNTVGDQQRLEHEKQMAEKKLLEIASQLSTSFHMDDYGTMSVEGIVSRIGEALGENARLKEKIASLKEFVMTAEVETKASRETIMRLVSEAEREQRTTTKFNYEVDNLRVERDNAMARQRELEQELEHQRERLDSIQRAWAASKRELDDRDVKFSTLDREIREHSVHARNNEVALRTFKETLAAILSDDFHRVEPYEEQIRDRVKMLSLADRDRTAHINMLETKLAEVTGEMEGQCDLQRATDIRAKRAEADFLEIQDRMHKLEAEVQAGGVAREDMRMDKEMYYRFLERLVTSLKMEPITPDLCLDSITDAIAGRAEQLVKAENETLVDRKTHIYNLQRKVKALKEQLDSKELHMDLLRKKVVGMEETLGGASDLAREKDEEFVKNKKLLKLVDRYKRELNEARMEIRDLKARVMESADVQARALAQEQELDSLEAKVGQLEHVRQKQASKISNLKDEVEMTTSEVERKRSSVQNTVQALSSELRTTKLALDEVTKRERQLLDLRQVLARMLGLDVNALAVPDYEVIARLEKLILANQANASTAVVLDTTLGDMEAGFRAGYEDAAKAISSTRSRNPMRRSVMKPARARSMSPSRKRDTRAY